MEEFAVLRCFWFRKQMASGFSHYFWRAHRRYWRAFPFLHQHVMYQVEARCGSPARRQHHGDNLCSLARCLQMSLRTFMAPWRNTCLVAAPWGSLMVRSMMDPGFTLMPEAEAQRQGLHERPGAVRHSGRGPFRMLMGTGDLKKMLGGS